MARILVVYGTTEGQTRKIATEIGIALRHAGAEADIFRAAPMAPGPEDYDGVIVAASLHIGKYQRPVRRWIKDHVTGLRGKPAAFVSVCLAAADRRPESHRQLEQLMRKFVDSMAWEPAYLKPVAGALLYTRYGRFTRWIMKRIAAKAGGDTDTTRDYEYTDWADVRAFAREFLVKMTVRPPAKSVA